MVIQVGDQASWPKNPNNRKPSEKTPEPLSCGAFQYFCTERSVGFFVIGFFVLLVIILILIGVLCKMWRSKRKNNY